MGNTRDYPAHALLDTVSYDAKIIEQFLYWLFAHRYQIGKPDANGHFCVYCSQRKFIPDHRGIERWIGEYFGIDWDEIDREKRRFNKANPVEGKDAVQS